MEINEIETLKKAKRKEQRNYQLKIKKITKIDKPLAKHTKEKEKGLK